MLMCVHNNKLLIWQNGRLCTTPVPSLLLQLKQLTLVIGMLHQEHKESICSVCSYLNMTVVTMSNAGDGKHNLPARVAESSVTSCQPPAW